MLFYCICRHLSHFSEHLYKIILSFCLSAVLREAFYEEIKFEILKSHLKYINMPFAIGKK